MKESVGSMAMRNICVNSDGSEIIYLNTDNSNNQTNGTKTSNELYLRFYALDLNEANSFEHANDSGRISRLKLARKLKLQAEYLPGICLSKIGHVRLGIDLTSLVIYDVQNLNLLVYDLASGAFRSILLRAEEYLGNVLAFAFTADQLHLVALEVAAVRNLLHLDRRHHQARASPSSMMSHSSPSSLSAGFEYKLKLYKFMECECHKNMVNKRSIYMERDQTADEFEHPLLTDSMEIFN